MKRTRTAAFAAVTAAAVMSVAACGGGGGSSSGSSGSGDDSNGAVLPNTAWKTAPYDQVKQGGTLVQAVSQLPINYNQLQANDGLGDTATLQGPVVSQTGVKFTTDGKWEVDPNYIESAKVTSKSPLKIAVKLNPKAVWSDGKPINYTDVVNFWKAFNGKNPKYEILSDAGWRDISAIDKGASDFEYTITYSKVNADWPNSMYPGLPTTVTKDPNTFNTGFTKKMYPSNGPYVISKIDANAGVVTETPNPRWWGRKPKLDKIVFRVVNQNSLGQAFANKEINLLDTQANPDVLAQAQKRSDAVIEKSGGLTWTHLTFNASKGPLADVHVRRAVAHAIDRKTFVTVVQKQLGVKPAVQGSVIYVPGQAGYKDVADTEIGYSLKDVASEMKAAGYSKGSDGMYAKGGTPLNLKITIPSDTPTNAQRAQLIQGFLKKAGIGVTLDTVPTDKYFSDYVVPKNYEMTSFSWRHAVPGLHDPVAVRPGQVRPELHRHHRPAPRGPVGQGQRRARRDQAREDRQRDRQGHLRLRPDRPLGTTPTIWAVQKGLVNAGASQFQVPPDYTQVGFTK